MLTLYAPQQHGNQWLLQADVKLGLDKLRLTAYVSPETLAWAAGLANRGWDWAQSRLTELGRRAGNYVELSGDWRSLGPVADMVASTAQELRTHPLLMVPDAMKEGVKLYREIKGEQGFAKQSDAVSRMALIGKGLEASDPDASEASYALDCLALADSILQSGNCYDAVAKLSELARMGDSEALCVLSACKALGTCCCSAGTIEVAVDGDQPIYTDSIAGYASDVMAFRAARRSKPIPAHEVQRQFGKLLTAWAGAK